MKAKASVIVGALVLGMAGTVYANSNASVQAGRLSLEGYVYSDGDLGLTAEVGLNKRLAVLFGNADRVPTVQLKYQLPDSSANADFSVTGGVVLHNQPGMTIGIDWHYKLSSAARIFADASLNTMGNWSFANIGMGVAYNLSKDAALIGAMRMVSNYTRFGFGVRFTL